MKAVYEVVVGEGAGVGREAERFLPLGTDMTAWVQRFRNTRARPEGLWGCHQKRQHWQMLQTVYLFHRLTGCTRIEPYDVHPSGQMMGECCYDRWQPEEEKIARKR